MSATTIRAQVEKIRANAATLKEQLSALESAETPDDLAAAVSRQASIQNARELIAAREAEAQALALEADAEAAEEARQKQAAALLKRAEKAAERYNDSTMAMASALAELQAVNAESIAIGEGAKFLAIGQLRCPHRLVENSAGNGWHIGSI